MSSKKFIDAHMAVAQVYANLSSAVRLKVGAVVVKDNRIISIGYNGTPAGWDNNCEELALNVVGVGKDGHDIVEPYLKTKPEVIHAEANAIAKLARSPESGLDAEMFVTHAPCIECAKLIYGAGIKSVFYKNTYRDTKGVDFLNQCDIMVQNIGEDNE